MRQARVASLAAAALVFACQWSAGAGAAVASSVQDLGRTEGKPITNGFVFIDGRYIPPPYIVTRQGNGIFINDRLVEQACPWPIPEKPKIAIPTTDPIMPSCITRATSMYDKELINYIGQKIAFLKNAHGEYQMVEMMVQVYRGLPCVLDAQRDTDARYITVKWVNGQVDHMCLILHGRTPVEWTRESALGRANGIRTDYEDRLGKGDFYFLGTTHGRITGSKGGARSLLPALFSVLKTSKNAQEVQQRLQHAGIFSMDETACKAFFDNRVHSKDLDDRIDALVNPASEH